MPSTALRITTLAAAFALAVAAPAAAQEPAPTGGSEATVGQPGLTVSPGALLNRTMAIRGQVAEADYAGVGPAKGFGAGVGGAHADDG